MASDFQVIESRVGVLQARRPGVRVRQLSSGVSKTRQEFRESADVNVLVARYRRGTPFPAGRDVGAYIDARGGAEGLHAALNLVREAEDRFMALDARVRKACENSAEGLMALLGDESRVDESIELGLREAPEGWVPPSRRVLSGSGAPISAGAGVGAPPAAPAASPVSGGE